MRMITKEQLEALRSRYPAGTRVDLLQMDDVQALQTEYPDVCFVSPMHAIRCPYSKTDYILGLDYCLEMLRRCDGIVMCGKWKESIGCVSEYMLARELCKDVKTADEMLVGTEWNEALAYARGEEFAVVIVGSG